MKKILILILLATGYQAQPKPKPYVSPYKPFALKMTEQQKEEHKLYIMRELWAQKQLREYEENRFDFDRAEP